MQTSRIALSLALLAVLAQPALAQGQASPPSSDMPRNTSSSVCVPGALIEALSEGGWYPAVVLDPLRDGRCFVHYENYGSDDDEALPPKSIRSRR
jgi:hypothetical protein